MELSTIIHAFVIIGSHHYNSFLTMITGSNRARERAIRFIQQGRVFFSQNCPTMSKTGRRKKKKRTLNVYLNIDKILWQSSDFPAQIKNFKQFTSCLSSQEFYATNFQDHG